MTNDFISNDEFYTNIGMDEVKTKLLLGCVPKWLLGPLGYALFALVAVLFKFRKPIHAFFVGGAKAARKSLKPKKDKKHKKKNKNKNNNRY